MTGCQWLSALAKPGRRLYALPGSARGYGIYVGRDRRRRPVKKVDAATVRQAQDQNLIAIQEDGSFQLTASGYRLAAETQSTRDDPQTRQHQVLETTLRTDQEGRVQRVTINRTESPLYRFTMGSRQAPPLIDSVQFAAGEKLRDDFFFADMGRPSSSDWSMIPKDKGASGVQDPAALSDARLDAKDRVMTALKAVGPGLDHLLTTICLRELGLRSAEHTLGWPERSAGPALRLALDRLAVHYRLKPAVKPTDPFSSGEMRLPA